MLAGLLGLVAVAAFVVMNDNQPAPRGALGDLPIISLMAGGMLAFNLVLSFFLPNTIARNAVRQIASRAGTQADKKDREPATHTAELIGIWQNTFIISRALLEGAGFFGGVAYLVEKHWLGLAVAVTAAAVMLLTFPTEDRIRSWVQNQEAVLDEMRLAVATDRTP
jgi:ABC-type Co2+ transport system permease subunit